MDPNMAISNTGKENRQFVKIYERSFNQFCGEQLPENQRKSTATCVQFLQIPEIKFFKNKDLFLKQRR
jgi:hypothetical protein